MLPARALALGARSRASLSPVVLRRICYQLQAGPENSPFQTVLQSRFQSTSAQPVAESPKTQEAKKERPQGNSDFRVSKKYRDITQQIQASVDAALTLDLAEAIDILEEGASYLREVQASETINNRAFYVPFQNILAALFDKACVKNASLGGRRLSELLDILIQHKIAHNYHFAQIIKHTLESGSAEKYAEALQIWVKFLEYKKTMYDSMPDVFIDYELEAYKTRGYKIYHARQMAYFCYVMQCINGSVTPSMEDAYKLLKVPGSTRNEIPLVVSVKQTLEHMKLERALEDYPQFQKEHNAMAWKNMDPNGKFAMEQIENAVSFHSATRLEEVYQDLAKASARTKIPISERRLNRVMLGFIEVGRYDRVFGIFRDMLAGGIKNPGSGTFDLVFKAIGHPDRVKSMTEEERKNLYITVDMTLAAMLASGVKMSSKTLAYVVSCFANLNRFDKVDEIMKQNAHLTMIDATKNNILIGLVMHNRIEEAEQKLKEYRLADENFTPYTYTMNSFFAYYTKNMRLDDAEKVLDYMKKRGIKEDIATATTAFDLYFKLMNARGKVPDVATVIEQFKDSEVKLTQGAVNSILHALTKNGTNIEAARAVYNYFVTKLPRYKYSKALSTTMLLGELNFGSVYNAEALFDMIIAEVENTIRVWNMMIRGLLYRDVELAVSYFEKLKQHRFEGVKPNFFTFYFMLPFFQRRGLTDKVQWALDELAKANLEEFGDELPQLVDRLKVDYKVDPKLAASMKL